MNSRLLNLLPLLLFTLVPSGLLAAEDLKCAHPTVSLRDRRNPDRFRDRWGSKRLCRGSEVKRLHRRIVKISGQRPTLQSR